MRVEGKVDGQICDDRSCKPVHEPISVALIPSQESNALIHKDRPSLGKKPGPAEVTITLEPKTAKPGEKVTLKVQLKLDENWHTYSITQKEGNFAQATSIQLEKTENLKPLGDGFQPSKDFEIKNVQIGDVTAVQEVYHGTISWSRELEVLPAAKTEGFGVKGEVKYQTCDANRCVSKPVAF